MSSKYLTREERLRNKIREELTQKQPKLDNIIVAVNDFEKANVDTIAKLNRQKKVDDNKIRGALKQTINAHGPITMEFIGSATKRINGSLMLSEAYKCPEVKSSKIPLKPLIVGIGIGMFLLTIINYFIG